MKTGHAKDPFRLQRLALAPCLRQLTPEQSASLLRAVTDVDTRGFLDLLFYNRLDQHWRCYLDSIDVPAALQPWLPVLREQALQQAARQLKQRHLLDRVHRTLAAQDIPCFVFKGAHLRYALYDDPLLRSSSDVDVFVPEARKLDAVRSLARAGFTLRAQAENISHEVILSHGKDAVDLHWQLLRPGRTRIDLSDHLMANRAPFGENWWGLNRPASLLVMLVHPAFTKHLASPDSMLIHMVDLQRLLTGVSEQEWEVLKPWLQRAGVRTAAWSSLTLLALLGGSPRAGEWAGQIQPGRLRRNYLRAWIEHDLIRRLFARRWLVQACFGLPLQDSVGDAVKAVTHLRRARANAEREVAALAAVARGGA